MQNQKVKQYTYTYQTVKFTIRKNKL